VHAESEGQQQEHGGRPQAVEQSAQCLERGGLEEVGVV
jgi:hypothetical protein